MKLIITERYIIMTLELIPLLSFAFVMSITPGPNNIMLTSLGSQFGFKRILPTMIGITLGNALQTYVLCLGLGSVFNLYPSLHTALKVAGVAYLLYLSWKLIGLKVADASPSTVVSIGFGQAMLLQLVNPKAWMMGINIATLFVPVGVPGWQGGLLVCGLLMMINFPSISVWGLFGSLLRHWLTNASRQRYFNWTMALSLAATAVHLGVSS